MTKGKGGKKRTLEEVEKEIEGLRELFKEDKIGSISYLYLMTKLNEELVMLRGSR